ncbi:uncharacterized protein J4E84_007954 [Alternaria hordeiaustralica]|uniref:uncharacterized protein n=1 Tax=Alternaria hordeiaustralica TaxID=1187925 RepID=UPI0020C2A5C9|nr:uncharacterized protein J4E84_007954 [Alternaria hordeiaustralica]KAI4680306.1 hypothetical protein J4E84_007954 [Alternaria hordeiaustralica]
MPTGDTPTKSWLPHPLERLLNYCAPADPSYHRIPTDESRDTTAHRRGLSKAMVYGILLGALIIGGVGSGWHFNQRAGRGEFPSLYEADIESVTKGLEQNHFTSVDLVKATSPNSSINVAKQTYITRINDVNDILRPVIEINPDALDIATALDEERSKGRVRGERMDTIGPLTKTVKDSAYVLQSIVGTDVYDNYTSAIPENVDKDFVGACKRSALKGARNCIHRSGVASNSI